MSKSARPFFATLLILSLVLALTGGQRASAYSPPVTVLKIGLYYDAGALPSANLQNVTGYGSGYQFGYLDANRQFVPLGVSTSEKKITMLRDRNMVYSAADNCYVPGSTGSVVVGCFHIQLNAPFSTYAEAAAAASGYALPGFVKYSCGSFYACLGNFISAADASAAIAANGLGSCSVTSGTPDTVTVVKTGTNTILFEFEYGSQYYLTVMPLSPDGATKCQTWFKGYRYYGGFQYIRVGGGDLTVCNVVDIEDYVKGVIPYEMSNTWPLEALKAQAVCARTYAAANIGKHGNLFDMCTTEDCQVYRGLGLANSTTDAAVDQTAGQYLTYNGQLCVTFYSSSDGGATENIENVWKDTYPYLRGVMDPYEADIASIAPGYSWTVTYTSDEITARLRARGYNCATIVKMAVSQYTEMGNVYKVTLTDANGVKWSFTKGESVRLALGVPSIRFTITDTQSPPDIYVNGPTTSISGGLSSSYAVGESGVPEILGRSEVYAITGTGETAAVGVDPSQQNTPGVFTISGTGRGHSVGMSQWGAYSMAKFHGKTYDQILKFYYTGVSIG